MLYEKFIPTLGCWVIEKKQQLGKKILNCINKKIDNEQDLSDFII
jgi:hypothetical protein